MQSEIFRQRGYTLWRTAKLRVRGHASWANAKSLDGGDADLIAISGDFNYSLYWG